MLHLRRTSALLAALALPLLLWPSLAEARVRVRHNYSSPAIQGPTIPDLPETDWKGLTVGMNVLTVKAVRAYLFPKPDLEEAPIGFLTQKTHVKRLGMSGQFYEVETADKKHGYVLMGLMLIGNGNIPMQNLGMLRITAPKAKLLMFPAAGAPVTGELPKGALVEKEGDSGAFVRVRLIDGSSVYLPKASVAVAGR